MEITKLSSQVKNPDRINVFLNNKYTFSLDISQIVSLKVKVGNVYNDDELESLKREGEFSKYYSRTLVYALTRPRSQREVRDYLYRQTRTKTYMVKGELRERLGMSPTLSDRIVERLVEKGYLDDRRFAQYWIENRNLKKGISEKTLRYELFNKGVSGAIVESEMGNSTRDDKEELMKVVMKRQRLYSDRYKFIKYLITKGYRYDLIQEVLSELSEDEVS